MSPTAAITIGELDGQKKMGEYLGPPPNHGREPS